MTLSPSERNHMRISARPGSDAERLLRWLEAAEQERDRLQGIVDDIASETGHCLLIDDEEHEAPPLPDWVRGIVKDRDRLREQGGELFLSQQVAKLREDRDAAIAEAAGYQRLAKETQESQDKSSLLVIGPVGSEFRVYGPTANSEERFAKTFADYWKLVNSVAESIESSDAAKKLADAERDRDAAIAKCESLAAERPISEEMYDHVSAELEACKAKLANPRRVLIHETEIVATKDEIAAIKAKLADLSEADEELHTCRALVNATSENLSVDLERMVDDLAEANEKAARSQKDAHSWHELYEDTKAKLAEAGGKVQEMCESIGRIHIADYVTESVEVLEGLDRIRAVLLDSGDIDALQAKLAALVGAVECSGARGATLDDAMADAKELL